MPQIQIDFPNVLNVSVQIGDIAYFSNTTGVGGFDTNTSLAEIGEVVAIGDSSITCEVTGTQPAIGDFIMFAKDTRANKSSLLGYFAEFKIINDSTDKAEIYSIATDVFESSK